MSVAAGRRSSAAHAGVPARRAPVAAGLLTAEVSHARLRPRPHAFRYRVSYLTVALDEIDALDRPGFGVDRAAPVSFHRRDHGARDGGDLATWIRAELSAWGLDSICDGRVVLQTSPRLLGYVFNPVSFWYCHDSAGALRAVLCAVSNTFGERHNYLVFHEDRRPIAPDDWLEGRKAFHVSPFLAVAGIYRFRFRLAADHVRVDIQLRDGDGPILTTSVAGRRAPLDDRAVRRWIVRNPLMTIGVVFRIHWQALRLWRKRARFFRKPDPPRETTTR
ncbi:MAG: DUF1365 domain-containing protein [Rhodospirillales bacterium]|nr:MAG: DUF1365 domain-containing protein [Rhodospirillales bacterium]